MWNAVVDGAQPDFWPPRPSRFWKAALAPLRRYYLRRYYGIAEVAVEGVEAVRDRIGPADGVLVAPNHSHDSDPHVMMEVGRRARRPFAFMAAWQIFRTHWGLENRQPDSCSSNLLCAARSGRYHSRGGPTGAGRVVWPAPWPRRRFMPFDEPVCAPPRP